MRHYRLHLPAEQPEHLVKHPAPGVVTSDGRIEDVGVADSHDDLDGLFPLQQPIDRRLNRGVCRPPRFRKGFLNLADGAWAAAPKNLHDPELEPGQFWMG